MPREAQRKKPRRCRGSNGAPRSGYASDISSGSFSSSSMEMFATMARSSLLGLNTGTGLAETSTGEPVRGLRAMRVFRCRILNVPKPRTSMFFCSWSASFMASRNESTTRAQSFLEIIGPAVRDIWAVTRSTRSAFVMGGPRSGRRGGAEILIELIRVNSYVSRAWRISPTPLSHRFHELLEQRPGIVRAGRGLRMVLDGEHGEFTVAQPLDRTVVQVHVGDLQPWGAGNLPLAPLHGEAVILGGDQNSPGLDLPHGVISPAVAVRHLHRLGAEGEAQQLMPQADAEHRHFPLGNGLDGAGRVLDRVRIARPIGEEYTVWLELEHGLGRSGSRHHRHSAARIVEQAQDVPLDTEVVRHDVVRRLRVSPLIPLRRRDARREIEPLHRRACLERGPCLVARRLPSGDDAPHDAHRPEVAGEPTRINAFEDGDLGRLQVALEVSFGAPVGVGAREL